VVTEVLFRQAGKVIIEKEKPPPPLSVFDLGCHREALYSFLDVPLFWHLKGTGPQPWLNGKGKH
jgi:hypothetical protein